MCLVGNQDMSIVGSSNNSALLGALLGGKTLALQVVSQDICLVGCQDMCLVESQEMCVVESQNELGCNIHLNPYIFQCLSSQPVVSFEIDAPA